MERTLRKFLAASLVIVSLPYGSAFSAEDEAAEWKCPATKGAYAGKICQCLEAKRPGGA